MKKIMFAAVAAIAALAVPASAQNSRIVEEGGTGKYKAIMMEEASLATHTIFRPQDLSAFDKKNPMPVVIWGNGGCANSPSGHVNFLNEVASQGFLIVAIGPSNYQQIEGPRPGQTGEMPRMGGAPGGQGGPGMGGPGMGGGMPRMGQGGPQGAPGQGAPGEGGQRPRMGGAPGQGGPGMGGGMPRMGGAPGGMGGGMPQMGGGMGMSMGDPTGLKQALEWVLAQNEDKNSPYYQKLDVDNIAAAGMSCGGLQALHMSDEARVKTILVMNSGYFGDEEKATLSSMKAKSVIWILGGPTDIAYENGMNDFKVIEGKPAFVCNLDGVGHGGTYMQPHGGEYAIVATSWLQWQLQNNLEAGALFTGKECGLSLREGWTVDRKNIK